MANDGPTSLGALYESNAWQHAPEMPNIPGSSLGSAYESWLAADQESQWLRALEERRSLASSDDTQVISTSDVDAYARQVEAQKAFDAEADAALRVSGRRGVGATAATEVIPTRGGQAAQPGQAAPEDVAKANAVVADQAEKAGDGTTGILRSSAIMAAGTMVSRVLGLLRSALTVWALGSATGVGNTWATANSLPNIIYILLAGGVINAVLVPQITRALKHPDGGKAYTDRIITLSLTLLFIVTVIGMALSPLIYQLYDHKGFTGDKYTVASLFTLICIPQIFFYGVYTILGQVLNARGRFGAFMWSPALANVVIIIGLIAFIAVYPHGQKHVAGFSGWTMPMILLLALPATLGIVVQALALVPVLRRAGYKYTPNFTFRGVGLRGASHMAGWAFAAVILQQIGLIVTTQLLTSQPPGEPGKLAQDQAFLIFTLPHSLITLSLVTALFTRMSVAADRGETDKVKADMNTGLRLSGIASVMLTFGGFVLVFPLVGAMFTASETNLWTIGSIAVAMMVGLVPFSLCFVIQRVFYAYNDAKTPFWMQLLCTGLAIALTVPWFWLRHHEMFGHSGTHWTGVGVGLAQTLSNTAQAIFGLYLLRKKIGPLGLGGTVRTFVRLSIGAIAATAVSYVVVKIIRHFLAISTLESFFTLAVAGGIFLVVYLGIAKALRVSEVDQLLRPIVSRLPRSRRAV